MPCRRRGLPVSHCLKRLTNTLSHLAKAACRNTSPAQALPLLVRRNICPLAGSPLPAKASLQPFCCPGFAHVIVKDTALELECLLAPCTHWAAAVAPTRPSATNIATPQQPFRPAWNIVHASVAHTRSFYASSYRLVCQSCHDRASPRVCTPRLTKFTVAGTRCRFINSTRNAMSQSDQAIVRLQQRRCRHSERARARATDATLASNMESLEPVDCERDGCQCSLPSVGHGAPQVKNRGALRRRGSYFHAVNIYLETSLA